MRLLLDECVPRPFRACLPGHDVVTVREAGWSSKSNGDLLRAAAAAGFGALITADQNLPYQQSQHLATRVVILVAPSNRLADLEPLAPAVLIVLATLEPHGCARVGD
jgi:hypothetical protein